MTKIISNTNCGNSPKMEFLKQFSIAYAEGNVGFLTERVSDDIVWNIIGGRKIEGKTSFTKALEEIKTAKTSELTLHQILSHGKEGAVNGIMKLENGEEYAFSDFYVFQSAKGDQIKAITSYCIKVKNSI